MFHDLFSHDISIKSTVWTKNKIIYLIRWNIDRFYCKIRFPNDFSIGRRLPNNNQIVNSLTRNWDMYSSYHLLNYGTYYFRTFWNMIKNNNS